MNSHIASLAEQAERLPPADRIELFRLVVSRPIINVGFTRATLSSFR